jgi:hypothetical protein
MGMGTEVPAVTKLYDIILWLFPHMEKFPRTHKFTIGDRMATLLLDTLEELLEAAYSREKRDHLHKVNMNLEKLRYMIRISKDMKLISLRKYEYLSVEINELGRMVGGWARASSG